MRTRACRFLPWLKHFEFRAPLVEASWSYPQFSRQLINAFARPHPLHGHSLKFPGVSLSFHSASFPGNCAQSCVSLQGFSPLWSIGPKKYCARRGFVRDNAATSTHSRPFIHVAANDSFSVAYSGV